MKILMISGDRSIAEGKRGAFYNTLEEFHKHWERVDIICPRVKSEKLKVKSLFENVFIYPSPWSLWRQPLWILKKGKEIYREQKFDIVTVHEYPPFYNGIGARLLWNKIKIPYVLEIMHVSGYPKAAGFKDRIYKDLVKIFIKYDASRARAVRVINKTETPNFLIKSGVPAGKLVHIPAFYIDLDIFKPIECEKKYDLIFVGRLEKNKGIDLFLEVAQKTGLSTIIVGDGTLREKIKLKIKNRKSKIDLYGWAKDIAKVAELLNKSRILVMPSYNEGGPRVVLEAMACGVSVLATPVGIVSDVVRSGESGEIINWDAQDIAGKTRNLLADKGKYDKYCRAGLEISRQFEKKEAIKNYAEKIKTLL